MANTGQEIFETSDLFQNVYTDLDLAGYWYILPALAEIKSRGLITPLAQNIFKTNLEVLQTTIDHHLLIKDSSGNYNFPQI